MRLLREPLVHFLGLGAALFLLFQLVGNGAEQNSGRIDITRAEIAQLQENWQRTWNRSPTDRELQGLIQDRIKEEIYYREALAMGLDRDDTIIKRRLRQKLEFLTDDLVSTASPTEEQLAQFLSNHMDAFRTPALSSFQQIYFSRDLRGGRVLEDAGALLERLQGPLPEAELTAAGDPLMVPGEYRLATASEIARVLGDEFAAALQDLPQGRWSGPLESAYGVHLVFVRARQPGQVPELADIRETVEREWLNARREEASELFYERLRESYEIRVEGPAAGLPEQEARLTGGMP